jgi:hypothetical protein
MRVVRIFCAVVLSCSATLVAQSRPASTAKQNRAAMMSRGQMEMMNRRTPPEPTPPSNLEVPQDAPVVTLEGVCDRPRVRAKSAGCKIVITRAQMDALIDTLVPDATQSVRSQFAINYARLVAAAEVAKRQHLENDPAAAKEIQARQKMVRMQVLASTLYKSLEGQAAMAPLSEVQKYYAGHPTDYEEGEVQRLVLPKSVPTIGGRPLDESAVKTKAEALRARAVAGEDFRQLQEEAYKDLGIKAVPPPTKLNMVRRHSLPPEEAKVFDLKVGETSEVVDAVVSLVVLKLDSKKLMPVETVQPEIESILQRERMQTDLRNATGDVKVEFNLKYLEMASAPELFPLQGLSQPPARPRMMSKLRSLRSRQRMMVRPPAPGQR